ncbi:MAG: hypothetical protein R2747_18115 [Pyrinomonadaceae bacterium]
MKNQANRVLVILLLAGFALLGIGCSTDQPPQTDRENPNKEETFQKTPAPGGCTEDEIRTAIPGSLKKQFDSGTITLSYAGDRLVFKGYLYGNGSDLETLLNGFDKFRSNGCVKVVSFEGESEGEMFRWCRDEDCKTQTTDTKCLAVNNRIRTSRMKEQISENLLYDYKTDGVLEFTGFVSDSPGKKQFSSLFTLLRGDMNGGCITKVLFKPGSRRSDGDLLLKGFEWQLCTDPNCECDGECKPCVLCKKIDNKNTGGANGNANNSNAP